MKLRKLVINDLVRVSPELASGEMACTCLGGFLLGGSNVEKWGDHRKENFLINNSVGLSLCDGPTETVKYIWLNI